MSICNLLFSRDRVILLTDQMVYDADGKPVELAPRKAETGSRVIWATRGSVGLGNLVDAALAGVDGFDLAMEATIAAVDLIAPDLVERGRKIEVTIAGVSDAEGWLRCSRIARDPKGTTVEHFEPGCHLSPSSSAAPRIPADISIARFLKLALAQQEVSERFGLKGCVGGAIHLTGVNSAGETWRELAGLYPTYDVDAATLGDPNAEEVAAWRRKEAA